jgi:hypothetical protein
MNAEQRRDRFVVEQRSSTRRVANEITFIGTDFHIADGDFAFRHPPDEETKSGF